VRRGATSRDVARAAGVSQALVSRVFTGNGAVAPATRERILQAAEELGWQRNALAASMVTGDAPLVAVIAARVHVDWRAKVLSRVLAGLHAAGVLPLMFYADRDADVPRLLAETGRWRTRGVLVTAGELSAAAAADILAQGRFVAALNRPVPAAGGFAIGTDNAAAGAEAARLLARAGRARLLVLAGPESSRAGAARAAGFRAACAQAAVWHGNGMDTADGHAAAARWHDLPAAARPDGVFAANDLLGIGFLDGLRAGGVAVPGDVAVIGFDDLPAASWPPYRLASFAQPVEAMVDGVLGHIAAHSKGATDPQAQGMTLWRARPVLRESLGPGLSETADRPDHSNLRETPP